MNTIGKKCTMDFSAIKTSSPGTWDYRWKQFADRDIHWSRLLFLAYEKIYGCKSYFVTCKEGTHGAYQAFLRYGDVLRHPFNFGGPLGSACVGIAYSIVDWKRREEIRHEYCTLHPLLYKSQLEILQKAPMLPRQVKDAVYIDLTKPYDLRETHRQVLGYARDNSVSVSVVANDSVNLGEFAALYTDHMERKSAADHWRFPRQYFPVMAACLGDMMSMLFAYIGNDLQGGCVLLHSGTTAYYHYAASIAAPKSVGINHSMVMAAAEWAKAAGYSKLFLGGGIRPDDGLFLFKSGFSKDRAPVYQYETVTP